MAIPAGLEPAVFDVTGRCFSQLNYGTVYKRDGYAMHQHPNNYKIDYSVENDD